MSSSDPANLTLVLMRHAKSDWADGSLSDHDRPLNNRGRRAAPRMAVWLKSAGFQPDAILSSTSRRTRETVDLLCKIFTAESIDVAVTLDESLYLSSPETILHAIRSEGGEAKCLMVVAHNPGMTHLSSVLAGESLSMATAAAAVFRVDLQAWDQLTSAEARDHCELIEFMRPKALEQS